jgi:hypothetical protein
MPDDTNEGAETTTEKAANSASENTEEKGATENTDNDAAELLRKSLAELKQGFSDLGLSLEEEVAKLAA